MTSEARFILNIAVVGGDIVFVVGSCLLALWKGSGAERWGAALFAASVLGTLAFEMITGQNTPVTAEMFLDTAVAVGFLVLAIRYNNLWLGAAMMVKGIQLAVHATRLTDGEDTKLGGINIYALSLDLIAMVICSILAAGTLATIRRRKRQRQAQAAADQARKPLGMGPPAALSPG